MDRRMRLVDADGGEDLLLGAQCGAVPRHPHYAVIVRSGEIGVQPSRGVRDAQQSALAPGGDTVHRTDRTGRSPAHAKDARGVALADQSGAVGKPGDAPGHLQAGGDSAGDAHRRR